MVETYFTPTNRGHSICRKKGIPDMRCFTECELVPDVLNTSRNCMPWKSFYRFLWSKDIRRVTPEAYVSPQNRNTIMDMTWEDFCCLLLNKDMVWLTPELFVTNPQNKQSFLARGFLWTGVVISTIPNVSCAEETNDEGFVGYVFSAARRGRGLATAASAWKSLLGLLARSKQQCIRIEYCLDGRYRPSFPISGPALSYFFQEIHHRRNHRKITLKGFTLDAHQCRALATVCSPGVEISLERCHLAPEDIGSCQEVFIDCLQRDRGPTELDCCLISRSLLNSNRILINALTGNTRVVKLRLLYGEAFQDDAGMGILFRSLPDMRGLLELNLYEHYLTDANWHILCESLKTNRTLTSLDLRCSQPWNEPTITNEEKVHRTRAIAEMLKVNTVLYTIKLSPFQIDQHICTKSVNPRLETNRYRPRVLAIKQADNRFRRAFLGRALQSDLVRNKSNRLWMFLSENTDIIVPSIEGLQ